MCRPSAGNICLLTGRASPRSCSSSLGVLQLSHASHSEPDLGRLLLPPSPAAAAAMLVVLVFVFVFVFVFGLGGSKPYGKGAWL